MKDKLKALLPSPERIQANRWLRWLGPVLHHPKLWHFSRRGIAVGFALGIFFGLLIPVAQIPASVTVAVILRANVPVAVGSTLISNPATYGPLWYGSYRLGRWILGEPKVSEEEALSALQGAHAPGDEAATGWRQWLHRFGDIGKSLVLVMAVMATVCGIAAYFLASGLWVLRVRWNRRQRLRKREAARGPG